MILRVTRADGAEKFYQLESISITPEEITGSYFGSDSVSIQFHPRDQRETVFSFMTDTGMMLRNPVCW